MKKNKVNVQTIKAVRDAMLKAASAPAPTPAPAPLAPAPAPAPAPAAGRDEEGVQGRAIELFTRGFLPTEVSAALGLTPEKTLQIVRAASRLIAMLNTLLKEGQRLFGHVNARLALVNLGRLRKRVAHGLQNPRILSSILHSFRHWYATMLYWRTNSILHVQEKLGHKRLETTTIYTHLVQFESDGYHSAVAENIEEARKLIEAGFEYVCDVDRAKLFRNRK